MASHSAVAHFNGYSSVSFSGHSLLQSLQHYWKYTEEMLCCINSYMAIFHWFQPKSKHVSDCLLSQLWADQLYPHAQLTHDWPLQLFRSMPSSCSSAMLSMWLGPTDSCKFLHAPSHAHPTQVKEDRISPTINSDVHTKKNPQNQTLNQSSN